MESRDQAIAAQGDFARYGINIPSTALVHVECMSADGRSFGGWYFDPVNNVPSQGIIITVPSPGPIVLAMGAGTLLRRRRR